jgi:hypothetical protein
MRGIDPQHLLRLFYRLDVQVHRDRLAIAAAQHALQHLGRAGVDLLVRNVGGHVDEVARPGLRRELQMAAPAHACTALDDVDHTLQMAVMVRPGFGVCVDGHGAGPQLLSAHAGKVDRGLAIHARCLCRVGVEPVARNHPHSIVLPGWWRQAGAVPVRPSIGMFIPVAGMLLRALVFFNTIFIIHSLEDIISSHTVLDKSIRHIFGYFSHSFQARAMTRNNESRLQKF